MITNWKITGAITYFLLLVNVLTYAQYHTNNEVAEDAPVYLNTYDKYKNINAEYNKRYYSKDRMEELKKQKEFQYDEVTNNTLRNNSGSTGTKQQVQYYYDTTTRVPNYNVNPGTPSNAQQQQNEHNPHTQYNPNAQGNSNSSTPTSTTPSTPPKPPPADGLGWGWILLIFLLLVALLLYAMGITPSTLFGRASYTTMATSKPNHNFEDIHSIQYETELDKAIRLHNYKLAVRLLYLENLKLLNDNKLIVWQKNKTNIDYIIEINNATVKKAFRQITTSFEYVWYGNFSIDQPTFNLIHQSMLHFKTSIVA